MKKIIQMLSISILLVSLTACETKPASQESDNSLNTEVVQTNKFGSFDSQVEWGEHLVTLMDCNTCHSPKMMTDKGWVLIDSLILSGHPAGSPPLDVNRQELESKGIAASSTFTEWVGPWGVSYASNLTPDETGIGNWTEAQFVFALREGKIMGLPGSRPILPPMPWQSFGQMTDDEMKAVFAYLKTVRPVKNIVPAPLPPVSAP